MIWKIGITLSLLSLIVGCIKGRKSVFSFIRYLILGISIFFSTVGTFDRSVDINRYLSDYLSLLPIFVVGFTLFVSMTIIEKTDQINDLKYKKVRIFFHNKEKNWKK